jgi:hypothetical protein
MSVHLCSQESSVCVVSATGWTTEESHLYSWQVWVFSPSNWPGQLQGQTSFQFNGYCELSQQDINPLTPELNPAKQRCLWRIFYWGFCFLNRAFCWYIREKPTNMVRETHHITRHNTPIHNILSTAPQLSISQKALGMLLDDGKVMPKHVGATIHN